MENIMAQKFCEVISSILSKITIGAFYHGSVDFDDAKIAADLIDKMLISSDGFPTKKYPQQLVTQLPLTKESNVLILPSINPKDHNNAIERYFQLGKDDLMKRVMIDLLSQILDEPFYDQVCNEIIFQFLLGLKIISLTFNLNCIVQLRTKDQFGYSVSIAPRWSFGVMVMSFRVVSSNKSAVSIMRIN